MSDTPEMEPTPKLPTSGRERFWFAVRAAEVRLRFLLIFLVIGGLVVYWDTIENYWDRFTRPSGEVTSADPDTEYYCPMHPKVVRTTLDPDGSLPSCPICGMPLSKRHKGEAAHLPEGVMARVQLSPERVQLAGIETAAAEYRPLVRKLRTVGYVDHDEGSISEIVSRVTGYVEELHVARTFEDVEEGQPLAEIYSPELYSTVRELLLARERGSAGMVASGRERLKLLGIGDAEIDDILSGGSQGERLVIRSPRAGHVVEKNVVQGSHVEPGAMLFVVADLHRVWVEADVYENDLAFVREGRQVEATVEGVPGRTFHGEVALVYPELNPRTRTNRVRIVLDNPEHLLRPGMFATVWIETPMHEVEPLRSRVAELRQAVAEGDHEALVKLQGVCPVTGNRLGSMGPPVPTTNDGQTLLLCCASCNADVAADPQRYLNRMLPPEGTVLAVPTSAVIDTGDQQVVFVEREPGVFEAVAVKLGPRAGNFYSVMSGLVPGEQVAAAGAFLLDAETRLNPSASAAYFGASGSANSGSGGSATSTRGNTSREASKEAASGEMNPQHAAQIARLAEGDQKLALEQRICPVTGQPLGSMGLPQKVELNGRTVFLCCPACIETAQENPEETLSKLDAILAGSKGP